MAELVGSNSRKFVRTLESSRSTNSVGRIEGCRHGFLTLVAFIAASAGEGLLIGVDGEDSETDGDAMADSDRGEFLSDDIAEDFVVACVTFDDTTETDDGGEVEAVLVVCVEGGFGDDGDFE